MSRVSSIQLAWLLHFTGAWVYGSNGDASPDGFEVSNRASKTAWHTNRRQLSPIKFPSFRADWKLVPGEAAGKGNRSPPPPHRVYLNQQRHARLIRYLTTFKTRARNAAVPFEAYALSFTGMSLMVCSNIPPHCCLWEDENSSPSSNNSSHSWMPKARCFFFRFLQVRLLWVKAWILWRSDTKWTQDWQWNIYASKGNETFFDDSIHWSKTWCLSRFRKLDWKFETSDPGIWLTPPFFNMPLSEYLGVMHKTKVVWKKSLYLYLWLSYLVKKHDFE